MNAVVYKNKSPAKAQQGKDDLIISGPPSMIEIGNQSNNSKDTSPIHISKQHDEVATSHYNILRSLPGYMVGDAMRNGDKTLCGSKEAIAFAMANLQRNDCVFILRWGKPDEKKWKKASYCSSISNTSYAHVCLCEFQLHLPTLNL